MKKLMLIVIFFSFWTMDVSAGQWECVSPPSATVIIKQKGEIKKTLYASISNAHCVNKQPLTSFTDEKTFDLPVRSQCQKYPERDRVYLNVNVYEKSNGTTPVVNATVDLEQKWHSKKGENVAGYGTTSILPKIIILTKI